MAQFGTMRDPTLSLFLDVYMPVSDLLSKCLMTELSPVVLSPTTINLKIHMILPVSPPCDSTYFLWDSSRFLSCDSRCSFYVALLTSFHTAPPNFPALLRAVHFFRTEDSEFISFLILYILSPFPPHTPHSYNYGDVSKHHSSRCLLCWPHLHPQLHSI